MDSAASSRRLVRRAHHARTRIEHDAHADHGDHQTDDDGVRLQRLRERDLHDHDQRERGLV